MPPIEPTKEQLMNRSLIDVPTNQLMPTPKVDTITSEALQGGQELNIPPIPKGTDYTGQIDSYIQNLLGQTSPEEQTQTDLQQRILDVAGMLDSRTERQRQLEEQAGLTAQKQELQSVVNQLQALQKEALAIPIQIQEEFAGRGATRAGVEPIQTGRLRQNAIKSLGLSAIGQTLQGNISLAESTIQKALDAEFEPQEIKLRALERLYTFNKDALERADKKRADALNFTLKERDRILEEQKADKKEVYDIGFLARQNGADTETVSRIIGSENREEALTLAGDYLRDPIAKEQLEQIKLNNILTKEKIASEKQKQYYLELYGGMTPSEYENYIKDKQKEASKLTEEKDKAKFQYDNALEQKTVLEGLLNHKGMTKAVGVYGLSRFTPFSIDKSAVAEFTGNVVNIIDQLTLNKLIEAKDQGATFGALSNEELRLIANAATPINNWKKERSDGSIYFEISETAFKAQLNKLINTYNDSIKLNAQRLGYTDFDDSENATMDLLWEVDMENPIEFLTANSTSSGL